MRGRRCSLASTGRVGVVGLYSTNSSHLLLLTVWAAFCIPFVATVVRRLPTTDTRHLLLKLPPSACDRAKPCWTHCGQSFAWPIAAVLEYRGRRSSVFLNTGVVLGRGLSSVTRSLAHVQGPNIDGSYYTDAIASRGAPPTTSPHEQSVAQLLRNANKNREDLWRLEHMADDFAEKVSTSTVRPDSLEMSRNR